jgi:NAD(P)H dehydrogenase (quinone)
MDLIVYAHHEGKSHNSEILAYVKKQLEKTGRGYEVIDLYKDKFNPVMPTPTYSDENADQTVKGYQKKISKCDRLILIFPIWWYNMPAILKGFFDRVFTPGFAFKFGPAGPEPLMADKNAVVINTFAGQKEALDMFGHAPIVALDRSILDFCGFSVKRVNWFNCSGPSELDEKLKSKIDAALTG